MEGDLQKSVCEKNVHTLFLSGRKECEAVLLQDHLTPKPRRQIELLQTPHICQKQKDLFTQLLGTETKCVSPHSKSIPSADHSYDMQLQKISDDGEHYTVEEAEHMFEDDQRSSIENALAEENRKRKRKSNIQLKILKQEFSKKDGATWSKQKIIQMANLTGLSESQVYKWCWDQKKKLSNGNRENVEEEDLEVRREEPMRTKLISKKDYTRRKQPRLFEEESNHISKKLFFN